MSLIQTMFECVIGPAASYVLYADRKLPFVTLAYRTKTVQEGWELLTTDLTRLYRTVDGQAKPVLIWRRLPTWERGVLSCRLVIPDADFEFVLGFKNEGEPVPGSPNIQFKPLVMEHLHKILNEIADELLEDMPWLK